MCTLYSLAARDQQAKGNAQKAHQPMVHLQVCHVLLLTASVRAGSLSVCQSRSRRIAGTLQLLSLLALKPLQLDLLFLLRCLCVGKLLVYILLKCGTHLQAGHR